MKRKFGEGKFRNVVVLSEGAIDLNNGRRFYDNIESGIGDYFFDSLIADVESLQFSAGIHSKYFNYYRLLSKRFPFALYYEIENDTVRVIAILDMRRNPSWNHEILTNRKS